MTNEKYTEEFQKALNDYIKLGFNQDECNGFMHGFHKGAEDQQLILPIVSKSEVFEHYGKPFTNGRDLWDFLTENYNLTKKT